MDVLQEPESNIPVVKAQIQVKKFVEEAEDFVPPETAQY